LYFLSYSAHPAGVAGGFVVTAGGLGACVVGTGGAGACEGTGGSGAFCGDGAAFDNVLMVVRKIARNILHRKSKPIMNVAAATVRLQGSSLPTPPFLLYAYLNISDYM